MRGYLMVIRTFLLILTREVRWHVGVAYGYPHLLSTRGKRARWHAETNVIICTFCQPEASEPADTQRLTSSPAPFVIQRWQVRWHAGVPYGYPHITVNPNSWSQVAGGDTQVVIRTNTLLLILTREVRWHAGVPYGYLYLLSTRGKRAHWHAETNVVICTFCQPEASESVET